MPGCAGVPGTLLHIATGQCVGLSGAREKALNFCTSVVCENGVLLPIIENLSSGDPEHFLSFLLDPCTHPLVISATQNNGYLIRELVCYMTRTWLYTMHKERLKLLGLWTY